jgi:hypothetical protein
VSRRSASEGLKGIYGERGGAEVEGRRGRWEEKEEDRPSKGGRSKSVVMPVEVVVVARDP